MAALVVAVTLADPAAAKPAKAPKVTTPAELAAEIQARGIGCEDFEPSDTSDDIRIPAIPQHEEGECTIDTRSASLAVFKSPAHLADALDAAPTICRLVTAFGGGGDTVTFVSARNWMVVMVTARLPKTTLAKPLGAKQTVVKCG